LRDEVALILAIDDAVKGGYDEYVEAGYDEGKLTLEGEPTRFVLRRMTYDQAKRHDDITSLGERVEFAIRCCLVRVTGYVFDHGDGRTTELPGVEHEESAEFKAPMVKHDWLRRVNLPRGQMYAVATIARTMSEASLPFPAS
jgi:hypothetical protein